MITEWGVGVAGVASLITMIAIVASTMKQWRVRRLLKLNTTERITAALAVIGPVLLAAFRLDFLPTPFASVTIVIFALVTIVSSLIGIIWKSEGQYRTANEEIIEDILRAAVHSASVLPGQTGAFLYVPNEENSKLVPKCSYNKEGKPDENIQFEKHQGCTGHAWGTNQQVFADLEYSDDEDLEETWKLTPNQIALTRHIKAVLATPIFSTSGSYRLDKRENCRQHTILTPGTKE